MRPPIPGCKLASQSGARRIHRDHLPYLLSRALHPRPQRSTDASVVPLVQIRQTRSPAHIAHPLRTFTAYVLRTYFRDGIATAAVGATCARDCARMRAGDVPNHILRRFRGGIRIGSARHTVLGAVVSGIRAVGRRCGERRGSYCF